MDTASLARLHVAETVPSCSEQTSLAIFASVRIEADTRRVLYALAIPEYMEAWLQLPEADRIECYCDHRSFDRFRIDLYSTQNCRGCIYGSCLLSKPDKVTYLWERDHAGNRAKSTVEFQLMGGSRECTLKLKHGLFRNRAETDRHLQMWRLSLNRLSGLMKGITTTS